jgi:hypothetical protein
VSLPCRLAAIATTALLLVNSAGCSHECSLEDEIDELVSVSAIDCGTLSYPDFFSGWNNAAFDELRACGEEAWSDGVGFFVIVDSTGKDSIVRQALVSRSPGDLILLDYDGGCCGSSDSRIWRRDCQDASFADGEVTCSAYSESSTLCGP